MGHEDCIEYLEKEHTPLVRELPHVRRFTVSVPTDPADDGYDEVAELRFENAEDIEAATSSGARRRAIADAENSVDLDESIVMTVEDDKINYRPIPRTCNGSTDMHTDTRPDRWNQPLVDPMTNDRRTGYVRL